MGVVATALWQRMAGDGFGLAETTGENVWPMLATRSFSA
jgi:hypothetical protein